ncbi:MAG: dihydroorotase, partial [Candidatus Methanomethylophilaceae archaeon]|nr:dihydroorotase [Candidatus Methanomethylophilaceae archaeon]
PGFTDPHVHFRDPGLTKKEDFRSGTMSALFGGNTCVLDMPNTVPPVTDVRRFKDKKSEISSKAYVDYGLFAALSPGCDPLSLAPMVCGFKLFMGSTTGNILMNDDAEILRVMRSVYQTDRVVSVHAEDDSMILRNQDNSNWDHLKDRPIEAEYNAVRRLAPYKGMKVNICHVTDAKTLEMASSLGFTTEVTMHHLMLCAEDSTTAETKVNPPLRNRAIRDGLVKAFKDNKVTMIGSDHAPHTYQEKCQDYDSAPGGIPSVETNIPMFMSMVKHSMLSLEMIVKMGSENPAARFGINKGKIAVGYDADLVAFDMSSISTINTDRLHSRAGYTPYEGREAIFPEYVFVRGQMQIENGEFCGDNIGEDIRGN